MIKFNLHNVTNTETGAKARILDHVIPLKGKNVCGLHVENNLRLIPGIDNLRKGNSFV